MNKKPLGQVGFSLADNARIDVTSLAFESPVHRYPEIESK